LIVLIADSDLPPGIIRWLSCYLRGRQARCQFRGATSSCRTVRDYAYVGDIPTPPPNIKVFSYADDFSLLTRGTDIGAMSRRLKEYLSELASFFTSRDLLISVPKSSVTLITPATSEAKIHPQVILNEALIPLNKTPKVLGVTFDTMLSFANHAGDVARRTKQRNSVLRALSGTNWGHDKETLLLTYKALARPILDYASPVWSHVVSKTQQAKLQRAQNEALRIATGCHSMASQDHLHQETELLPVADHHALLTAGFLVQSECDHHPCHDLLDHDPSVRKNRKSTIPLAAGPRVSNIPPSCRQKKKRLAALHEAVVRETVRKLVVNRVTSSRPPPPHPSEKQLNRRTRRHLAQLRSGHCHLLRQYQARIDEEISPLCRFCGLEEEDVAHTFICPALPPRSSRPTSLWLAPAAAATDILHFGVGAEDRDPP